MFYPDLSQVTPPPRYRPPAPMWTSTKITYTEPVMPNPKDPTPVTLKALPTQGSNDKKWPPVRTLGLPPERPRFSQSPPSPPRRTPPPLTTRDVTINGLRKKIHGTEKNGRPYVLNLTEAELFELLVILSKEVGK